MSLLKNSVGRPSNETLKKRKMFYIVTVVVLIATMLVSGFLIVTKFSGNLNSDDKNASYPAVPSVAFYAGSEKSSNIYKPGVLGNLESWTNKNVIVVAKSNAYSVGYDLRNGSNGKTSSGKGKKITITNEGTTDVRFKACTKANKCSYTKWYFVNIDKTIPSITFNPTKSGTYITGSVVKGSCRTLSGVASMSCWETQNSKNKINKTFANNVRNSFVTLPIALRTIGSNRTVTCTCVDKAGNKVTKVSLKFKITPRH